MLQRRRAGVLLARRPRHHVRRGGRALRCALYQLGRGRGHAEQTLRFGAGAGKGGGTAVGSAGQRSQGPGSAHPREVGGGLGPRLAPGLLVGAVIRPLPQVTVRVGVLPSQKDKSSNEKLTIRA